MRHLLSQNSRAQRGKGLSHLNPATGHRTCVPAIGCLRNGTQKPGWSLSNINAAPAWDGTLPALVEILERDER